MLKAFRKCLKGAGKMAKVVIVAVMRKMITMLINRCISKSTILTG